MRQNDPHTQGGVTQGIDRVLLIGVNVILNTRQLHCHFELPLNDLARRLAISILRQKQVIPKRADGDSFLGFPNRLRFDSTWQTEEVCHGWGSVARRF